MNLPDQSKDKGFTLIELLLIVALLFILGGTTSVFMSRFLLQNTTSDTADQLAATLRKAQFYAQMGKLNSTWKVNYSSDKITLLAGSSTVEVFNVNPNVSITGFTEVILAAGLFAILVPGVAIGLTQSWDSNRLGLEQTIATQYASEGLEEARRLRNQSFASLVDGTTNSTFDKYSRSLIISTIDAQTKKIDSNVLWSVSAARSDSVNLTTYLTDWKASIINVTCSDYCQANAYVGGTCRYFL